MGSVFGKIVVETPKYEVIEKYDNCSPAFEVRQYGELVEAYTTMTEADKSSAFRRLAGYIGVLSKPKNHRAGTTKSEAIAMTGPVVMQNTREPLLQGKGEAEAVAMTAPVVTTNSGSKQEMSFILPAKYTFDTAPIPNDPLVNLRKVNTRRIAAHVFSGTTSMEEASQLAQQLSATIGDHTKYSAPAEAFELYQYNDPFTIPCYKTNEVAIPLVDSPLVQE